MAHVIPFHGTLYNPSTVGDVRQVVAPPYDIIDSALQKTLHDRHPKTSSAWNSAMNSRVTMRRTVNIHARRSP